MTAFYQQAVSWEEAAVSHGKSQAELTADSSPRKPSKPLHILHQGKAAINESCEDLLLTGQT